MSDAATLVQYIEDGETVIAEEQTYEMPHQSDWTYVDGEAYKVYDVVHTVLPDAERVLALVFVWAPDSDASDATLDVLYDRAVSARAGEFEFDSLSFGDSGSTAEILSDETTTLAQVTLSAFPSDETMRNEGIHVPDTGRTFVISDVTHFIKDGECVTGIYVFEVDSPEKGASIANVRRTLTGQRSKAQE